MWAPLLSLLLAVIAFCVQWFVCIFNVNRQMMKKESILVLGSPSGGVRARGGWECSRGFLGLSPASVCGHTTRPLPTAPKDVATLSLKVLKDSKVQHVQWVGTCCMQKLYCVWSFLPSCCAGVFASCDILCVVPPHERRWPGSEKLPQVKLEVH